METYPLNSLLNLSEEFCHPLPNELDHCTVNCLYFSEKNDLLLLYCRNCIFDLLKRHKILRSRFFCQTALQNGTRYMWHATTRFCRKSEMKFRKVFFNKKGSIEFLHFMDFSYSFHGPANKGPNPKVNLKENWVCQMITMSSVVPPPSEMAIVPA